MKVKSITVGVGLGVIRGNKSMRTHVIHTADLQGYDSEIASAQQLQRHASFLVKDQINAMMKDDEATKKAPAKKR